MCQPTRKLLIRAYRSNGLIGCAIRWQTRSQYSHVALQFGSVIFESRWRNGVQQRYVADPDYEADAFAIELPEHIYAQAMRWCESHVGDRYDWLAILRFVTRRRCTSDTRWFCSEFAYAAIASVGIRLLAETEDWEVSPGLLVRSPLLTREPK